MPLPRSASRSRREATCARTWRADLARYIGTRARASEVLNGKRPRTLAKIGKLREGLGLRAEALIRAPDAA